MMTFPRTGCQCDWRFIQAEVHYMLLWYTCSILRYSVYNSANLHDIRYSVIGPISMTWFPNRCIASFIGNTILMKLNLISNLYSSRNNSGIEWEKRGNEKNCWKNWILKINVGNTEADSCCYKNIPYGQSSAKLPVTQSLGHSVTCRNVH